MGKKYLVPCYGEEGEVVVGMVPYTENLDKWNGRNWNCGEIGRHLGVGKTKDGRYYICYGTQWQGERNYARIVSEERAKQICMEHDVKVYEDIFGEPPPEL